MLGNGLNPAAHVESPARQVTVQAIARATRSVLATTTTDTRQLLAERAVEHEMFIRARAEMIKTGRGADLELLGPQQHELDDALYALDGDSASSGTANSTRNLNAPSGFGGNNYTGERAAAPFAILDTVFRAKELVLSAVPNTAFPDLSLFWSEDNRPTAGQFCPDHGDISTPATSCSGRRRGHG